MITTPSADFLPLEPVEQKSHFKSPRNSGSRTKRKRECFEGGGNSRGASPPSQSKTVPRVPGCPWILPGKHYSPDVLGLHEEINDFFQWMVPTPEEHQMRVDLVERIRSAIKKYWPKAEVKSFGSFKTGLYLPTSDIDLVILGNYEGLPLRTVERVLLEEGIADPDQVKVLDKATVPIIKMVDRRSQVKFDISFNMVNGLRAAELIKHYKKAFPALSKLIYVLKQFLLQRDLNEVFTGGLSSYALILLTVSFLQLHPRRDAGGPKANLGVLLIEFFELYGRHFNFMNNAIRVADGGSLCAKREIQLEMSNGHQPGLISIQDPLDPTNDVGRSSYGAFVAKQAFEHAFVTLVEALHAKGTRNILSSIVRVSDELVANRTQLLNTVSDLSEKRGLSEDAHYPHIFAPTPAQEVFPRVFKARDENSSSDSDTQPPSGSPSSAMSISPATSEVGVATKSSATQNGKRSTKGKFTFWGNNQNGAKDLVRADLDFNWRMSSAKSSSTASSVSSTSTPPPTKQNNNNTKPSMADKDKNWRDHDDKNEQNTAVQSNCVNSGKKNKKQQKQKPVDPKPAEKPTSHEEVKKTKSKRRKKNKGGNKATHFSDSVSEEDNPVRFSCKSGLESPDR